MRYIWNEPKRRQNIAKHGIDFLDVPEIFEGAVVTIEDDRVDYQETRWISVGVLRGRIIVVVYTQDEEMIKLISARKATKYEERNYWKQV